MKVEIKRKLNKKEVNTLLKKIKVVPKLFDAKDKAETSRNKFKTEVQT